MLLNSLRKLSRDLKNGISMLKSYSKQDNVAPRPQNIILFKVDFNVKFPLLHFLLFLSDSKSTIFYR